MAYKALEKLFYGDDSVYIQTYKSRFDSEDTVKLDFLLSQHQAFFVQNTEVLKLAYEIVKLDKSVAALCAALPGVAQEQYSKKCLIDEIVITNTIEGVHSSRKEISDALGKGGAPPFCQRGPKISQAVKEGRHPPDHLSEHPRYL